MASPPIVELRDITKKFYFQVALNQISLALPEGEVFGYIGPNGAGKTTTLKILAGLISTFDGELLIEGKKVARDRRDVHQLIGFLPQLAGFQNWRTVDSALRSLATLSGVPSHLLDERITGYLERFELAGARHKKVKELSGGMTQKLGLIQAMLHEPKLLVLDEPLSGLDPASRKLVKEVVRERRAAGATVIFSSHILSDVQDVADRVGILCDGHLITAEPLDQLKAEFGTPPDVAVGFSAAPSDVSFLTDGPHITGAIERRNNDWVVSIDPEADIDAVIHSFVESTLRLGGRLRRIGIAEPNLDELYTQYVTRFREANAPTPGHTAVS